MNAARLNSAILRSEIEDRLAKRAPAALTPRLRRESERFPCGIAALDQVLAGGVPVGAITELVGAECSGRTTMALAYTAACIQQDHVAAWIDVDDMLDPEAAAMSGVDWERLLWVRCGRAMEAVAAAPVLASASGHTSSAAVQPLDLPIPQGGGGSPHPRSEGRGMSQAIQDLLQAQPRSSALPLKRRDKSIGTPGARNRPLEWRSTEREEQVATDRRPARRGEQLAAKPRGPKCAEPSRPVAAPPLQHAGAVRKPRRVWDPLDQALRATDLLLQSGGFRFLVLDLGSTPAEMAWRIPLATWFRYRAACERTRTSLLLLTQHPCARSSAELVMRLRPAEMEAEGNVLTGLRFRAERERQRFEPVSNVVPIRKPPQAERPGAWKGRAAWAI